MARGVNANDMSNDFAEETHVFRGVTYVMRELPMDKYDKLIKDATAEKTIKVDGEDQTIEETDWILHSKLLTAAAIVSPSMTPEQLFGKGTRLVRELQRKVMALHVGDEPEDKKTKEDADDDEGEAPAPASE